MTRCRAGTPSLTIFTSEAGRLAGLEVPEDSPSGNRGRIPLALPVGKRDCALGVDKGRKGLAQVGAGVRQVPFQDSGVGVRLVDGGRLPLVEQVVVYQPVGGETTERRTGRRPRPRTQP